ncbi:hypothetical protein ACIRVF_38930 [Kitasatospora sp. NPDC101157]|uniref:hypothetical protein n=1 Tax=Kitasatospora sp. NPDC101157 TaxID=3364098 RepID=UPI0037FD4C76
MSADDEVPDPQPDECVSEPEPQIAEEAPQPPPGAGLRLPEVGEALRSWQSGLPKSYVPQIAALTWVNSSSCAAIRGAQEIVRQFAEAQTRLLTGGIMKVLEQNQRDLSRMVLPPIDVPRILLPTLDSLRMALPAVDVSWAIGPKLLEQRLSALTSLLPDVSRQIQEIGRDLTRLAEMLLPSNLRSFGDDDWAAILDISAADGIVLAWAPRANIVQELVQARHDQEKRHQILGDRRDEILADIEVSLQAISQDEVKPLAQLVRKALSAAQDGHNEAALTLVAAVLDQIVRTYAERLENNYASSMPPNKGKRGPGLVLLSTWQAAKPTPKTFRSWLLIEWLIIAGMQYLFAPSIEAPNHYNRHRVAHLLDGALNETYVVPALLVAQGILRHWEDVLFVEETEDEETDQADS